MSLMAVKTRVVAPSRDTGSQKALRERNIGLVMATLLNLFVVPPLYLRFARSAKAPVSAA